MSDITFSWASKCIFSAILLKKYSFGHAKKNVEFTNLWLNFDKLIIRPLKTFVLPANLCFPCWVDVIMHFLTIILPLKMKGADMLLSVPPPFFCSLSVLNPLNGGELNRGGRGEVSNAGWRKRREGGGGGVRNEKKEGRGLGGCNRYKGKEENKKLINFLAEN